jgi:hypothetical protein
LLDFKNINEIYRHKKWELEVKGTGIRGKLAKRRVIFLDNSGEYVLSSFNPNGPSPGPVKINMKKP